MGGFPSGQRGQTVNLLQIASVVRIHLRPLSFVRQPSRWRAGLNSSSKPIRCAARRKEVCPLGTSRAQEFASKFLYNAGVAELADAQDLKSCRSNTVPVRFRSPALLKRKRNVEVLTFLLFFCCLLSFYYCRRLTFYQLWTKHCLANGNVVD